MLARALGIAALLAAIAAPLAGPRPARAEAPVALEGVVVGIHDGDTITLRAAAQTLRVRLAQIDAPERRQPWGRRAREALGRLAHGKPARLVVVDRDDYGRTVGELFVGGVDVNETLVREGHAWAYPRYVRSQRIVEAEEEARREKRGLWRLPPGEREPPWEWRRTNARRR